MCCFSGPVKDVAATRIFARMASAGRQLLAYEMQFAADVPVAMILPIPTPPNSPDDAVRFISLENYPTLFEDLYEVFAYPGGRPRSFAAPQAAAVPQLVVHSVGAFVASFVPSLADFTRLDPQFRLPAGTLDRVPTYADYGFVVFQLDATKGKTRVHPMAFEFPTRSDQLFFPLVHVHDGALHAEAHFDHALYAQGVRTHRLFDLASRPASTHMFHRDAKLVVELESPVARCELVGTHPNRDQWVQLG
jgi:hypothetical protein